MHTRSMRVAVPTSSSSATQSTTRERSLARFLAPRVWAAAWRRSGTSESPIATRSGVPPPIAFARRASATCGIESALSSQAHLRRSRRARCLALSLLALARVPGEATPPLTWATALAISGTASGTLCGRWRCRCRTSSRRARALAPARRTSGRQAAPGATTRACARTWRRCRSS